MTQQAQPGFKFLLKKGKDDDAHTIAGLRATNMHLNNELIDVTHKDSNGARTLLGGAGIQSLQLSASGVFMNSDVEEETRSCAFLRAIQPYSLFLPNGDVLKGDFYITRYDRAGDHNGEETYSLTLESSGKLSYVKADT